MSDIKQLSFVVPGPPIGKPRMTQQDKWKVGSKARPCVAKYRNWADLCRLSFREVGGMPESAIVMDLSWVAMFVPPRTWSKKKKLAAIGTIHRSKPDRDNIDKAVLDSLFKDDSGIGGGTIEKYWDATARLEITISYLLKENGVRQ